MIENSLIRTNTVLYCKEWEKTVAFYRDQLKLPILFATDWFAEFGLNEMSRLSIADEKRSSIKGCSGKGVTIAFEVNDIEAARECSVNAGLIPTPLKSHPWDARVFYIHDPEGHRIEIWQPNGRAEERNRSSDQS